MLSQVNPVAVAKGIATYVPGLNAFIVRRTGGTSSARYCYSVWLRHLCLTHDAGLPWPIDSVGELGPGDSIGAGLAALLSGASNYVGLDAYPFAGNSANLDIFEELIGMFKARTPIPDNEEFPLVWPVQKSWDFPRHILTDELLAESLAPSRLELIRGLLRSGLQFDKNDSAAVSVRYAAPWFSQEQTRKASLDLIFSQAVMEHVDEVPRTYSSLREWLKPGGMMSHTIDYTSHKGTREWNGHWTVSDGIWGVIMGRRRFRVNRLAHSDHVDAMKSCGLRVIQERLRPGAALDRRRLTSQFRHLTDTDLMSSSGFVVVMAEQGN